MNNMTRPWKRFVGSQPDVIRGLLIANLVYFALSMLASRQLRGFGAEAPAWGPSSEALYLGGAMVPHRIVSGEWRRFVVYAFLHGNLLHIGVNMLALYQLGNLLRQLVGSWRFMTIYLSTALVAGAASFGWAVFRTTGDLETARFSVGASGALFGIMGYTLGHLRHGRDEFSMRLKSSLTFWLVINLAIGLQLRVVDNAAHIGGFLAGYGLAHLADMHRLGAWQRWIRRPETGAVLTLITALVLIWNVAAWIGRDGQEDRRALGLRELALDYVALGEGSVRYLDDYIARAQALSGDELLGDGAGTFLTVFETERDQRAGRSFSPIEALRARNRLNAILHDIHDRLGLLSGFAFRGDD